MSLAKWKVRLKKGEMAVCYQELSTKNGYPLLMGGIKLHCTQGQAYSFGCLHKKEKYISLQENG